MEPRRPSAHSYRAATCAILASAAAFVFFWLYFHEWQAAKGLDRDLSALCYATLDAAPLVRGAYRPDVTSRAWDMPMFKAVRTIDSVCESRW